MHRAHDVLTQWNAKVASPVLRTLGEVARDETIAGLHSRLREANTQVSQVQGKLDALAAVTANLYHENLALKRRLGSERRLSPLPDQV
ncbi:hypothetical protein [Streptomyces sp. WM6378]|uniref:hypothetical protein n=1 Tax=Streptomyces sp. WM6378 TaxID=1415557 RepID=UPI000AB5A613|nr:hypothetical protein [Streptomyces sp. WM6378]